MPTFSSQAQIWMIGGLMVLAILTGIIVKVLWNLREPLYAAIRQFMITPEGQVFMEGVVNGKVRREIADHNASPDAHSAAMKQKADVADMNDALNTIRVEMAAMLDRMQTKSDAILGKNDDILKKLGDIQNQLPRRK